MNIIPAIDIIDGKCVRLTQGEFSKSSVYYPDPLDAAKAFADAGLKRLHLVDLDGAKSGKCKNYNVMERIASRLPTVIDYSGGLRTTQAIRDSFSAGAGMVAIGSAAVKEPELMNEWLTTFGSDSIILSADINANGFIATKGWLETSNLTADNLIDRFKDKNLSQVIATEIARDGMLCGINIKLYKTLQEKHPGIKFTASGGISSVNDIIECAEAQIDGVIVGKAFYEGRITLKDLSHISEELQ